LLLVAGTRDPFCSADAFTAFTARLPWATARLIEDADHFFFGKLFPLGQAMAGWARELAAAGDPRGRRRAS
jgi:alpha/beta superfamily hydrolase